MSRPAMAAVPAARSCWPGRASIHCTDASASACLTPNASRSANCHGVTVAGVGMCRSMNRAHDVQKAQSPS